LFFADQVVQVTQWVIIPGGQEVVFLASAEAFCPSLQFVFNQVPSRAPLVLFKSSRVFVVAPWVGVVDRWIIAAPGVGQTFFFGNTFITAVPLLVVGW
jgi:hypothetical protein